MHLWLKELYLGSHCYYMLVLIFYYYFVLHFSFNFWLYELVAWRFGLVFFGIAVSIFCCDFGFVLSYCLGLVVPYLRCFGSWFLRTASVPLLYTILFIFCYRSVLLDDNCLTQALFYCKFSVIEWY
jgi:hypothetical protein